MCVRWELYNEWRLPHCIVRLIGCPSIHSYFVSSSSPFSFFFTWDQHIQYILYWWIDGYSILNFIPKIIQNWEYCAFVSSKSSRNRVLWVCIRPVHKNLFLEFPKKKRAVLCYILIDKQMLHPCPDFWPLFFTK